jgi:hypothetical protein
MSSQPKAALPSKVSGIGRRRPQHRANLPGQRLRTERLLDERRALLQDPKVHDGVIGVAGHEKHLNAGLEFLQPVG